MAKRFTDSDKWKKGFIRGLSPKYKLFWFYILDDCTNAGVWETDFEVASIRIGIKITEKEAINCFARHIKIFDDGDKWFIPKFVEFQYGVLNANSRPHQSVIKQIEKYNLYDLEETKLIETAKPTIKRFERPTLEDVLSYCVERENIVEGDKFFNFYESNGWKVGKNPMKDWKAAVRSWESNSQNYKGTSKGNKLKTQIDSWQKARDIIEKQ
tara:strand:+ start:241 stop:876 length:636 start_codon:yes stop_codon:yes gene_type:complete